MKKRHISLWVLICTLCCAMGLGLIGCSDGAGDTTAGLKYNDIAPIGCEVVGIGSADVEDLNIPTAYKMSPVKRIAAHAFENNTKIKTVTVGAHATYIGSYAFAGCTNLEKLTIPNSVSSSAQGAYGLESSLTDINDHAFSGCVKLSEVNLSDSVAVLKEYVFEKCTSLKQIELSDNIVAIGAGAFAETGLTSVKLPTHVTSLSDSLFENCKDLTSAVMSERVTSIGAKTFKGCSKLTTITINSRVTAIGESAFENCASLTSITIPNGVTRIDANAFAGCTNLTSITIPASVKTIGDGAFSGCAKLATITLPDTVTSLGTGVLDGTAYYNTASNWENGVLYNGKHLIDANAATLSGMYTVKADTISLDAHAFEGCTALTGIDIPAGVTKIDISMFEGCTGLTTVTVDAANSKYSTDGNCLIEKSSNKLILGTPNSVIPSTVTAIGDKAFKGYTALTTLELPENLVSVGKEAFAGCTGLTTIAIGDKVSMIDDGTFKGCTSLASIVIGKGVSIIKEDAFEGCTTLATVYFGDTAAQWAKIKDLDKVFKNTVTVYFYAEKPAEEGENQKQPEPGKYWYYNDADEIVTWTVEAAE